MNNDFQATLKFEEEEECLPTTSRKFYITGSYYVNIYPFLVIIGTCISLESTLFYCYLLNYLCIILNDMLTMSKKYLECILIYYTYYIYE